MNLNNWFDNTMMELGMKNIFTPDAFGEHLQCWMKKTSKKNIRTLSLFSGAGGLDIGFHDAGFNIVECVELEKLFSSTIKYNADHNKHFSDSNVKCIDINDYIPELKDIDFIIGGPPCQTFSAAGARAAGVNGLDDDRGNLFREYARILKILKPKGFLFENVYRIVGAQGGEPWRQIQETFSELGYKLHWRILDAADYGTPQFRERLIIIGLREGEYLFPYPSHGPDSQNRQSYFTAEMALTNVSQEDKPKELSGRHGHLLEGIPPGLNYSFYTEKMGHPQAVFGWRSKFSDYLYKADPDMPVRTIKAQGGQYTGPFHWDARHFSTHEVKRLQTFPDNYFICGPRQKIIHQLGNSVPPQMARILALSVMDQVFGGSIPSKIEYMSNNIELGFRKRKRLQTKTYQDRATQAIEKLSVQKANITDFIESYKYEKIGDYGLKLIQLDELDSEKTLNVIYHKNELTINLLGNEKAYQINIDVSLISQGLSKIKLISSRCDIESIFILWKALELKVKDLIHKDDLVQYFGYYQYKNSFEVTIEKLNNLGEDWDFYFKIMSGKFVGKLVSNEVLREECEISSNDLFRLLSNLKKVGYEIRNHNTNSQIDDGDVLIPYLFPTLNDRSLQRLTSL